MNQKVKVRMDDLKIPLELKKILKGHGKHLLPVQALTIDKGFLKVKTSGCICNCQW